VTRFDPDQLTTGLIHVDTSGRVAWLNRAAAVLLDARRDALIDRPLCSVSPALERLRARTLRIGSPLNVTEAQLFSAGPALDLFVRIDEDGCRFELHPVTERLRKRERAERAERDQSITLLARRLAHELRNPLAGVRGAAQLIEQSSDRDAARRHAQMIQREVDRITALIDHVAEERPAKFGPCNPHRILDDAIELVQAESGGRLTIQRHLDPSIPEQEADEGRLHQLFLNLLRNSVQAGAETLTLHSRIEHDSAWVDPPARHAIRIDIDDDGEGVADTLRDRLFLPLVTGRDQGTGFGLAVVQQIARAHGGLVDYCALDRGSRFTLRIPLQIASDAGTASRRMSAGPTDPVSMPAGEEAK
jgi:two-component system nitrogen regulation sensor histidine kinase GlnL